MARANTDIKILDDSPYAVRDSGYVFAPDSDIIYDQRYFDTFELTTKDIVRLVTSFCDMNHVTLCEDKKGRKIAVKYDGILKDDYGDPIVIMYRALVKAGE